MSETVHVDRCWRLFANPGLHAAVGSTHRARAIICLRNQILPLEAQLGHVVHNDVGDVLRVLPFQG